MLNSHSINRNLANENFKYAMWQARKDTFMAKLWRKPLCLKSLEDALTDSAQQKRYLGVAEIPTDKIVGSVGRQGDFDGRFRPLKNHLRERWVNIALLAKGAGWPPIDVFKVGDEYFVLDGHHRTSFARSEGIAFIDANVWEITQKPVPAPAPVFHVTKELFSQKALADKIVIHDSMVCCCA